MPGKLALLSEMGIKESDWRGKCWPLSHAVQEAGLTPNHLQEAYDKDEVIEKVIELARRFGRFPVTAEIRLAARNCDFPSDTTVDKHLGAKAERCREMAEYCRARAGYDVIRMCETALRDNGAHAAQRADTFEETGQVLGYVYLPNAGRAYKIGHSNSPGRRAYEIGTKGPSRVNKVHEISTDDPRAIEEYWHRRFGETRSFSGPGRPARLGRWFGEGSVFSGTDKTQREIAAMIDEIGALARRGTIFAEFPPPPPGFSDRAALSSLQLGFVHRT